MTTTSNEVDTYRIEHPSLRDVLSDLHIPAADPGPGDRVPSFDLATIDGGRFSSDQLDGRGLPLLLVFGSLTCPVTESAGRGLGGLHRAYGDRVRFVLVNVREAHPGASLPQPSTIEAKTRSAERLRSHHGLGFEVAVDDIDGGLHRAFGTRPSSAYLIDPDGTIRFRAHWSNLTGELEEALAAVTAGKQPPRPTVAGHVRAMLKLMGHASTAFAAAGRGAMVDMWRAAPPMALMLTVTDLFRFVSRDRRGVAAMATMAAVTAAVTSVLVVAL